MKKPTNNEVFKKIKSWQKIIDSHNKELLKMEKEVKQLFKQWKLN